MKKIILLNAALLMAMALFGVPAKRGVMTVSQPDGTTLDVCLHGDERFHYATTDDGYLLAVNADGVYEYAEFDGRSIRSVGVKANPTRERSGAEWNVLANLRKNPISAAEQRNLRGKARMSRAQTPAKVGSVNLAARGLLILVNYSDVQFQSVNTQAAMDAMLNGENYDYQGATGSARQYFIDQSGGKYKPQFDVVGPVTLPNKRAYYGGNDTQGNDLRAEYMVLHACSLAVANFAVDFSQYDNDGDGEVDFVYILYAGVGEADSDVKDAVWPHSWSLEDAGVSLPTYNGKKVNNYACSGELDGQTGERCGIGTFCHEFSHVLGLPDYYDTKYGTNYDNDATPGKWSLMDQGSYNHDGKTPPNYSAHDKFYFGWAMPTIMDTPSSVSLPADGATYRAVTAGTLSATSASTVFYFENRQQTGWDAYLPGHGMLVTKVAFDQSVWSENTPNNGTPMLYDILEADGKATGGDAGDTYPGTARVTTCKTVDSYDLTDIAESTDGLITFNFMGGPQCDFRCTEFIREHCTLVDSTQCMLSGETYTATIEAEFGYELLADEDHFAITMGGKDLAAGADYTFADGVLTIPNVTADLAIYAVATKKVVPGYVVLRYDDMEGVVVASGVGANSYIDAAQTFTVTFTAAECYETLTDDNLLVEVKVGGSELTDAYTVESGVLTITLAPAQLTDDVSIIVYAEDKPAVTFDGENCTSSNAAACVDGGSTFTTTITPAAGYAVTAADILITMGSDDVEGFTFEDNVLTVANVTKDLYILVSATKTIPTKTIAEFIEAEGGQCYLTGVVSNIANTEYGNFDLTDESGKIFVYGLLTADSQKQQFASLNVEEKDTLTVLAETYKLYKGTQEVVDAVYVSHKKYVPSSDTELTATAQDMQVRVVSADNGLQLFDLPTDAHVRIFDAVGRLLIDERVSATEKTYRLGAGLYVVHVSAQGRTVVLKAIR